jgi:hypothetical protein
MVEEEEKTLDDIVSQLQYKSQQKIKSFDKHLLIRCIRCHLVTQFSGPNNGERIKVLERSVKFNYNCVQ